MFNKSRSTALIALVACLLCSACADQTKTMTLITPTSQHASIKWDETVAADTTAHVNNTSLIFMR